VWRRRERGRKQEEVSGKRKKKSFWEMVQRRGALGGRGKRVELCFFLVKHSVPGSRCPLGPLLTFTPKTALVLHFLTAPMRTHHWWQQVAVRVAVITHGTLRRTNGITEDPDLSFMGAVGVDCQQWWRATMSWMTPEKNSLLKKKRRMWWRVGDAWIASFIKVRTPI